MKDGTFVRGVPVSNDLRKKHPTVYGNYVNVKFDMAGQEFSVDMIKCEVEGSGTEVHVDCEQIEPYWSSRRQGRTVI